MAVTRTAVGTDEVAGGCCCCGENRPEAAMVRLSCHQEVAVCFRCLGWLNRQRASKRRALVRMALPDWVPDLPRRRRA